MASSSLNTDIEVEVAPRKRLQSCAWISETSVGTGNTCLSPSARRRARSSGLRRFLDLPNAGRQGVIGGALRFR
jgi:hypothetical protein